MIDTRNKEQVYDEEINPLMAQILAICKDHKIAMVASFALPIPDDPNLHCTSALLSEDHLVGLSQPSRNDYLAALSILKDGFIAFTRRRGL